MRLSGFLLGGIAGAAVALYVSRNKPAMLAGLNWDKALDKAGKAVHSAKAMWDTASVIQSAAGGQAEQDKTGQPNDPDAIQALLEAAGRETSGHQLQ